MSDLSKTFNPTHTGLIAPIPEHIQDYADEIEAMIGNALRVVFCPSHPNIQIAGNIACPTPEYVAITLYDQNQPFGQNTDKTGDQITIDRFIKRLAKELGDKALIDNEYDMLTLTVKPSDLHAALLAYSRKRQKAEYTHEANTYLSKAIELHTTYRERIKTVQPRPI